MSGQSDQVLRSRIDAVIESALGRIPTRLDTLAPGLGARRFYRAFLDTGPVTSLIVRVEPHAPPALPSGIESEPPMEPIRRFLEAKGLPVPARLGGEEAGGITLLEDLGDESLEQLAGTSGPEKRRALYQSACDLVVGLQQLDPPEPPLAAFSRRLDARLILTKATKWLDWALPALLERDASPAEREAIVTGFSFVAEVAENAPARLAHRDFKAANLHLRQRDAATPELTMIDFQGAFLAPPEYDLVCLLRDSHVTLPQAEVDQQIERIRPALRDVPDRDEFSRRFDLLTVCRVAKDLSHYLDAARTRRDTRYLRFVPDGLSNLRAAAARAGQRDVEMRGLAECMAALPDPRRVAVLEAALNGSPDASADASPKAKESDPCAP